MLNSIISNLGTLGIGILTLQANALIYHADHFNLEVSNLHMRYNSTITGNRITVSAKDIMMEGEASFDTTGMLIYSFVVLPEKVTYRDYFRRRQQRPDFLVCSITLSL